MFDPREREIVNLRYFAGLSNEETAARLARSVGTGLSVEFTAGANVGPHLILRTIGEGGCGVVYLAQQSEPLRRKVALKLIKEGMDTRPVVTRFEAERHAPESKQDRGFSMALR